MTLGLVTRAAIVTSILALSCVISLNQRTPESPPNATPSRRTEPALPSMTPERLDLISRLRAMSPAERAGICCCFAPNTDPSVVAMINEIIEAGIDFRPDIRWTTTASNPNGTGLLNEPITIRYSVVPDGTAIYGSAGEASAPSNLVAAFNAQFGSPAVWMNLVHQVMNRWSALSGITYVYEPNDDGAQLGTVQGAVGIRGDVRISGHTIDGPFGILAYNFFPENGDMVIDTSDVALFGDPTSNFRYLRNTLAHEAGHGLGLRHVCPTNSTKLMEPYITTAFDGPQSDDVMGAQYHYGDDMEPNQTTATARDLGWRGNGAFSVNDVSCDAFGDVDCFKFSVVGGKRATISVQPQGSTYLEGPQTGGGCTPGTLFNSLTVANLAIDLIGPNGSTVMATADQNPAGLGEVLTNMALGATPGAWFIRVRTTAQTGPQAYSLTVSISDATTPPTPPCFVGPIARQATGTQPGSAVLADVNNDGKLDVICSNRSTDTVSVHLGNGAGGLGNGTTIPVGNFPQGIAVADLNGDSIKDIVCVNRQAASGQTISILRGQGSNSFGNGTFIPWGSRDCGGTLPRAVAAADLDGDGDRDLVVTNEGTHNIQVRRNDGVGTFLNADTFLLPTPGAPDQVVIKDIDHQNGADIIVSINSAPGQIQIFRNAHAATLSASFPTSLRSTIQIGSNIRGLAVGDVNNDGNQDIVAVSWVLPAGQVHVLLGNGQGAFTLASTFTIGARPLDLQLADFNVDGKLDAVVVNENSNTISVLEGDGTGQFARECCLGTGPAPVSVAVGDMNGDNHTDMAVTVRNANQIWTWVNAAGSLTVPRTYSAQASLPLALPIVAPGLPNQPYGVLLSVSPPHPATTFGAGVIALTPDAVTAAGIQLAMADSPWLPNGIGTLDSTGNATAFFVPQVSFSPTLVGLVLRFNVVVGASTDKAISTVPMTLVP